MHRSKHRRYEPFAGELERANVSYEPMVWSAFGRPHAGAVAIIRRLAQKAARRRGLLDGSHFERQARAKIGVDIWRRAACMVRACLPCEEEEAGECEAAANLGKAEPPDILA